MFSSVSAIPATQKILSECLKKVTNLHGGKLENTTGKEWIIMVSSDDDKDENKKKMLSYDTILPEGFTAGSLRPEHAETVVNEWVYLKSRPKEDYDTLVREV